MIQRTTSTNPHFQLLVRKLDQYLAGKDGDLHPFYDQYNKIDNLNHVVIVYADEKTPVACGAVKEFDPHRAEIKRMYVLPEYRGKGFAKSVLAELEQWALELGYAECILETGREMSDAIGLYQSCAYAEMENFGPYVGVGNSVCLHKKL
jgi:putative acetyltransferase